jgi:putative ABC transport system permease protein
MRLFVNVSPGLFGSLGTEIKAGRDLTWTNIYGDRKFVLVSENLARELWGSPEAAMGKRVRASEVLPWREVLGVVEDVRHSGPQEVAPATVYWPIFGQLSYAPRIVATRAVVFFFGPDGSRGNRAALK